MYELSDRRHRFMGGGRTYIPALVVAQCADAATTLYGLEKPGVVELNPIVDVAMTTLGAVLGLLVLTVATLCLVVTTIEALVRRFGDTVLTNRQLRHVGYGPHLLLTVGVVSNNVYVILAA